MSAEILQAKPKGDGKRVGVVVSRFNAEITDGLLKGTLDALAKAGRKHPESLPKRGVIAHGVSCKEAFEEFSSEMHSSDIARKLPLFIEKSNESFPG